MTETAGRVAGVLVLLVALWISVYWWMPTRTPKVSFAQADDTVRGVLPKEPALKMEPEAETPARVDPVPVEPVQPKPQHVAPEPKVTPKPEEPERPIVVVPPQFTQHTVQKGETFDSIARKYFGPKAKGSIIANANPMVDPKRLMPGRVLQVPKDPNNIQGVPVKPKSDPVTPPAVPVAAEEYVVQEGDTLSSIAQEVYGESRLWDVIYQANRDQLPRENALKIGQKLKVPAKPAR